MTTASARAARVLRGPLAGLVVVTAAAAMGAAPMAHAAPRLPVSLADCGPGSLPETGLQGDVPAADRDSGRSTKGYRCNIKLLGGYTGHGGGITSTSHDDCAYMGSLFPGSMVGPDTGVAVVDAANPTHLRRSATLRAPALQAGTWESLKVNEKRKLLVGTAVPLLFGAGLLAVYDVSDCRRPRLLNGNGPGSLNSPLPITAHEGGFSPDGRTYWTSSVGPGLLSAVDLTHPSRPRVIAQALTGLESHGIGVSPDGKTLYLSHNFGGLSIYDISDVQRRRPNPQIRKLAKIDWTNGWATQHSVPVSYGRKQYLFTVLEGGSGGVKVINVTNRHRPREVNNLKLQVNLPRNQDRGLASSVGGGVFAYESHYCAADRQVDPTALACGWTSSGIRVFDVRDPLRVKEIAYYNPPARTNRHAELWNSPHALASVLGVPILSAPAILQSLAQGQFDPRQALSSRSGRVIGDLSTDWCFSPPEWRGNRLYVTCSDNGFQVLELTNGVYSAPPNQRSTVGS
ncbi:LVIVD repeat-containing protein [Gordonia crocea]|uniref:Lipoprotein n=1 Tax=Gordonia crocea TaxID=589162 RepID=A0A7I9V259_9ACTN|nr:hypothetical protein [Gordonia crocea]GED99160.1 hypothetical protein nbrc107697_31990 [Gordonia crocea]